MRRVVAGMLLACLSACAGDPVPQPSVGSSSSSTTASPTTQPEQVFPQRFDVTDGLLDGGAQRVVERLWVVAGRWPAIKLDVTPHQVVLVVVDADNAARAYRWRDDLIERVDSDVRNSRQTAFDPTIYPLRDLRRIFDIASLMGANGQEPMLQVAEYRGGDIYLSVTTRPETGTVFFRPDGTAVRRLGVTSQADITEGLEQVLQGQHRVLAVGFSAERGYWSDVPAEEGQVQRRTRKQNLPLFSSLRSDNTDLEPFSPRLVNPTAVVKFLANHRVGDETCSVEVDNRHKRVQPVIRYDCEGRVRWSDMAGRDMTDQFG